MTATVTQFRRNLLRVPEIAAAIDLTLAAESDEEHAAALYGVVIALEACGATKGERSPVWRRLMGAA